MKELAEQLKAQLKEANRFKETMTQISAKRSGVEVSNKSLFKYILLLSLMSLYCNSDIVILDVDFTRIL